MGRWFFRKTLNGVPVGMQVVITNAHDIVVAYWFGTMPTKSRQGHWRKVSPAHARLRGDIERAFKHQRSRLSGE